MPGMSSQDPKSALFTQFAAVAKAVAHPHRLALLEQLAQGERSVDVLATRIRASIANASQHLQLSGMARGRFTSRREPSGIDP
jgi:ArsR family transcriptional regulator